MLFLTVMLMVSRYWKWAKEGELLLEWTPLSIQSVRYMKSVGQRLIIDSVNKQKPRSGRALKCRVAKLTFKLCFTF